MSFTSGSDDGRFRVEAATVVVCTTLLDFKSVGRKLSARRRGRGEVPDRRRAGEVHPPRESEEERLDAVRNRRVTHRSLRSCTEGHGTEPYEQKTQQSPGSGLRTA